MIGRELGGRMKVELSDRNRSSEMTTVKSLPIPGFSRLALLLLAAACLLPGLAAAAQEPGEFIRLADGDDGKARSLQVALARYVDDRGRRVDLVSAVHVADREYFHDLQERFDRYESVLYELVGDPDGGAEPSAGVGLSLVGLLQGGMKNVLGLAFQLEEIDYGRANFVHADMTSAELSDSMTARNETWLGTFMQMWAASSLAQSASSKSPEAAMLQVLFSSDRQAAFKRVMAESLVDQQSVLEVLGGDQGSVLITERNRKALSVLERELAGGARRLAIFYGAGHMPDFHRRLVAEHGFALIDIEWVDAWRLTDG